MPRIVFTAPATVFDFRGSDGGDIIEELNYSLDGLEGLRATGGSRDLRALRLPAQGSGLGSSVPAGSLLVAISARTAGMVRAFLCKAINMALLPDPMARQNGSGHEKWIAWESMQASKIRLITRVFLLLIRAASIPKCNTENWGQDDKEKLPAVERE